MGKFIFNDRSKCGWCGHVFEIKELRWISPVMVTLCDKCHDDFLNK